MCIRDRARDVRGLELDHGLGVVLEDAGTGDVGQVVGVRHTDGGPRLGRGEGPQTQPVGQEGVQTAQLALFQALRGEQHVHTHRPADTADLDEHVDEVGLGGQQFGELVEHHHQRRQRVQGGTRGTRLLVVGDVGVVARRAQQLLTALEFTGDGVAHAVDEGDVLTEVGDDGRDVRHLRHTGEGGATLEVRKDEVEGLRGVGDRERQHQGAQHLGLTGTGRTDTQAVRAHALLRGLLDVEHDGLAVLVDTDRHPQPLVERARPPRTRHIDGTGVTEVQQIGEVQVRQQRLLAVGAGARPQRGQLTCQRLRLGDRQGVADTVVDRAAGRLQHQLARPHLHGQTAPDLVQVARYDLQDGDALKALGPGDHRVHRDLAAVQHDHHMRGVGHRSALRVEPPAALQLVRQQLLDLTEVADDQPAGARAVRGLVLHLREPLGPLPLRLRTRRGDDRHHQVLGRVHRAQLGDDGARGAVDRVRVTRDGQVVEGAQRDRERQIVQLPVLVEELLHRMRGERLQLVDRSRLRGPQGSGQLLRPEPQPYLPEVRIGRPAFPYAFALGHDRPQLARVGVGEQLRVPLLARGPAYLFSLLRKVLEVILALLEHLPGRPLAGLDDLHDRHCQSGRHHKAAHDFHERLIAHEQESRRGRHAHHGHKGHQHVL